MNLIALVLGSTLVAVRPTPPQLEAVTEVLKPTNMMSVQHDRESNYIVTNASDMAQNTTYFAFTIEMLAILYISVTKQIIRGTTVTSVV